MAFRRSGVGQRLVRLSPAGKQLRRRTLEQAIGVANGERVGTVEIVEFGPVDRRRHRGACAGARRIRQHRGRAALVAQPVEKDAALALRLADVGGEPFGLGFGDGVAEALGEGFDRGPVGAVVKRGDDVDAFASRQ